jgi:hypothetical protein
MIDDLYLICVALVYAFIGALARAVFGLFKVQNSTVDLNFFGFNWRRVALEICVSVILGTIGIIIITEAGWTPPALNIKALALVGGLFGPDILKFITKKMGITKAFDIRFTDEQVLLAEYNPRQIAALKYLKENGMINNSIYQELNQTSDVTSKRDLAQLARKKKVKKFGRGKATYYKSA